MWEAGPQQLADRFAAHWQIAAGLAVTQAGMTGVAISMLPRDWRENVSLWMIGAPLNQSWVTSSTKLSLRLQL